MRAPKPGEITPAQRARRGVKLGMEPADPTTRSYSGSKRGVWTNSNGTQVGQSSQEDSTIIPTKSTGDTATPRTGKRTVR